MIIILYIYPLILLLLLLAFPCAVLHKVHYIVHNIFPLYPITLIPDSIFPVSHLLLSPMKVSLMNVIHLTPSLLLLPYLTLVLLLYCPLLIILIPHLPDQIYLSYNYQILLMVHNPNIRTINTIDYPQPLMLSLDPSLHPLNIIT